MSPSRGPKRVPGPSGSSGGATSAPEARCVQAWVELRTDDPEAVSALAVARARLSEGRGLTGVRRFRLFELSGPLPVRAEIEDLLHRSTWVYNPHKERCSVRASAREASPAAAGEQAVLVVERGAERCPAVERWWLHETGQPIEVRMGWTWVLRFEREEDAAARAGELAVVRGREHGLLCNPNAQDHALAPAARIPLPWIVPGARAAPRQRGTQEGTP